MTPQRKTENTGTRQHAVSGQQAGGVSTDAPPVSLVADHPCDYCYGRGYELRNGAWIDCTYCRGTGYQIGENDL